MLLSFDENPLETTWCSIRPAFEQITDVVKWKNEEKKILEHEEM